MRCIFASVLQLACLHKYSIPVLACAVTSEPVGGKPVPQYSVLGVSKKLYGDTCMTGVTTCCQGIFAVPKLQQAVIACCSHKIAEHLRLMQDINPQLVARLSQRLFFVVNKIDLTQTSEGLDTDEIKHYVANLVTSQLATEGFQLSPDQVGPFHSHSSLLCTLHDLCRPSSAFLLSLHLTAC